MKTKKLLLMVLALVWGCVNVSAQRKTYKVEDNGFEWYEIIDSSGDDLLYGAEDRLGRTILKTQYSFLEYEHFYFRVKKVINGLEKFGAYNNTGEMIIPIEYDHIIIEDEGLGLISVYKDEARGLFDIYGKCIIPVSRKYSFITSMNMNLNKRDSYYLCMNKSGRHFYFDALGKVIFETNDTNPFIKFVNDVKCGKYAIIKDFNSFVDANDNVLMKCKKISYKSNDINSIRIQDSKGTLRRLTQKEKEKVLFTGDLFSNNIVYFSNRDKATQNSTSSSHSSINKTNDKKSSDNRKSVIIEHHRDPVPVQEWVQCTACWGSTVCPNCAGSGTTYIGSNLHRCSRCGGRKICTSCSGQGGRYVTVYK